MFYSKENELKSNQVTIEKFWQTQVLQEKFVNCDTNLAYAYCIPKQAKYSIVISSGRIETLLKYKELIWEFYNNNIAVFILDHRGQGLSERALKNTHIGHINDFSQYTDDFNQFNLQVVDKHIQGDKFLLAHSMGSAIAHNYLTQYQHTFKKAIFCAPMFGINTGNVPVWLAKVLAITLNKLGLGEKYAPGQSNYQAKDFNENELTQSQSRYQLFTECYQNNDKVKLGGTSIAWLNSAFKSMAKIMNQVLTIPSLILQAECDTIVCNQAQTLAHNKMPLSNLVILKSGKHELLCETDEIRQETLSLIYEFCGKTDKGS